MLACVFLIGGVWETVGNEAISALFTIGLLLTRLLDQRADVNGLENLRAIISVRDDHWRKAIKESRRAAEADSNGE